MSAMQAEDGLGGVNTSVPVRAINRSDQTLRWGYANVTHTLEPGIPTFIPYLCMCLWQGDPRAVDIPGGKKHEQYRRNGREALAVLWGVYEHHERWDELPKVDCYPIDSDVPFQTIMADPDGVSVSDQKQQAGEIDFMRREMEKMASQMRAMQGHLAMKESGAAAIVEAGLDPADLDHQVATSRAVSPEAATGQSMVGASPTKITKQKLKAGEGPKVTKDGE